MTHLGWERWFVLLLQFGKYHSLSNGKLSISSAVRCMTFNHLITVVSTTHHFGVWRDWRGQLLSTQQYFFYFSVRHSWNLAWIEIKKLARNGNRMHTDLLQRISLSLVSIPRILCARCVRINKKKTLQICTQSTHLYCRFCRSYILVFCLFICVSTAVISHSTKYEYEQH